MAFKSDFRPDIVAGNPPYNNGMDIDFVFDSFKVAKIAVSMVVPAKWQTSEADQRINSKHSYGDFRREIVPHMDKVVFYPEGAELFEIRNTDGITIYTIDKQKTFDVATIINHCRHQKYFESVDRRSINNRETLHNIGVSIIEKVSKHEKFMFDTTDSHRYAVWTGNQINGGNGWGYSNREDPTATFNADGKFKCTGSSVIVDNYKHEVDSRGASSITFTSDSDEECKNFISWIDTKLVRFLVAMNISKLGPIFTNDYFRFVPKPFKDFSEPYTDLDMYVYYGLTIAEVEVIDNLILER